jgi:hypothetical protein
LVRLRGLPVLVAQEVIPVLRLLTARPDVGVTLDEAQFQHELRKGRLEVCQNS